MCELDIYYTCNSVFIKLQEVLINRLLLLLLLILILIIIINYYYYY